MIIRKFNIEEDEKKQRDRFVSFDVHIDIPMKKVPLHLNHI